MRCNALLVIARTALALFSATPSLVSAAAAVEAAGMPEYAGQYVVKTPAGLIPLERQLSTQKVGLFSLAYVFTVPQSHSSVTVVPTGQKLIFYIRTPQADNPQDTIQLRQLTSTKDRREYVMGTENLHHEQTDKGATPIIPYVATKSGTDFFELVVPADIPPGEYGWTRLGVRDTYLFSVAPKS